MIILIVKLIATQISLIRIIRNLKIRILEPNRRNHIIGSVLNVGLRLFASNSLKTQELLHSYHIL